MRRSDFLRLTGLDEPAFKILLARKQVPLGTRATSAGWKDYSADDALALQAALALARQGATKSDAREWVDAYLRLAIEWASARPQRKRKRVMYLGAARVVGQRDGQVFTDHHHPAVGDAELISEQLAELERALDGRHWIDGLIVCNLTLCTRLVAERAIIARIEDERLAELQRWFG